MKRIVLLLAFALISVVGVNAQLTVVNLDADSHGSVVSYDSTNAVGILDDGGEGPYSNGDYYVTINSSCSPYRFCLQISVLDIDCRDTLYIYDGPDINSPVRAKINSCTGHWEGERIFIAPTNNTGLVTVRFHSVSGNTDRQGFSLDAQCGTPCETVVPIIDSMFYRTRRGVIYDSAYIREVPVYDTLWNIAGNGDTLGIDSIVTTSFMGAHLCVGDGVIFRGHGEYTYEHGYYTPADSTTLFTWDMANEGDSIVGYGFTEIAYAEYQRTGCYDMVLSLTDAFGCESMILTTVRVRTSINPIKTIFTLQDICNHEERMVNMGYSGENATLTLREVESDIVVSKINEVRTFIPDGPSCPPGYYIAPVTFTEFPHSKKISRAEDVCSICINMEHSFMGDVTVSIVCPTNQEAFIFWGNQDPRYRTAKNVTNGIGYGGSSKYMGYEIQDTPWDSYSNKCDSLQNPFGVGLDYCFSRNGDYTLVTGQPANTITDTIGTFFITSSGFMDNYNVTLPAVPSYFTNSPNQVPTFSGSTKHPSDHLNKTDYYIPYTDFSELIGCPLNGTWYIKVEDKWGSDNGWVFNWSMDICGVSQDDDCKYTVGIDSLIWKANPDTMYHDYDLGHYRGLQVRQASPTVSYISSPDTAGTFPIDVLVYDDFGCIWDTSTSLTTFWRPMPNLGPDTGLCGDNTMVLNASDRHAATNNFTYIWAPFAQTTDTISTYNSPDGDLTYIVQVVNNAPTRKCINLDTINVALWRQPLPNFIPTPFVFEGCDPFTISFDNQSVDADRHLWVFGDGVTSTLSSPTHTYAAGIYDLKYYAYSSDGCVDSIISPQGIAVYDAPKAAYAWEPIYPSVLHPIVRLENRTEPNVPTTKYFWEVQYNPDAPRSVHTVTDVNPVFDFSQYIDDDPVGLYSIRLIARTDNLAPSGNMVYCRDTTENTVLLVNDFLQFPNVVTPNGDGINDRFVIQNLVDGLGYPVNMLDIYNKWGAHVYHRENISRDEDFWDPKDVPAGTYFYRFSARGYNGNIEHNGAIEVVK